MRDATPWLLAIALALALTALAYGAIWLALGFSLDAATATAETYHWRDVRPLSGVVLRSERLLPAVSGTVVLHCADGQRVAAGEPLGVAAATGEEFFRGWLLQRLETELAAADSGGYDLSESAFSAECGRVRAAVSRNSQDDAAEAAGELCLHLFPDEQRRETFRAEIEALSAAGAGEAILAAPESGYFLRSTDGWEGLADVRSVEMLDAMAARGAEPTTAAGRLVTGSSWRFAAVTDAATAARFPVGEIFRLEINGAAQEAEVTRHFPGSGAREGVLFTGRTGLERLLNARFVELTAVLAEADGLRIPAAALREEDGEMCVYRLAGRFARRETVTVLARLEDGVLVVSDALRPGSRVLLSDRWADGDLVQP